MSRVQYQFADGNGNVYLLTAKELEYIPVKPEESSSGFYSGGEPKSVTLTTGQFDSLKSLFDGAINNPAIQLNDRIKTSGVISIQKDHLPKKYILQPGCIELTNIEVRLKEVISQLDYSLPLPFCKSTFTIQLIPNLSVSTPK